MCRYATTYYRDHFACFHCRKTFKHSLFGELKFGPFEKRPRIERVVRCPECRAQMPNVGLDFKAPRQSDRKQWRKAKMLLDAIGPFTGCGRGGFPRPATWREVPSFLVAREREQAKVRAVRSRR